MQREATGIAVVGPTASGKSDLALRLARPRGAEIVNFDSVQVYRGFDIGSAKLPEGERMGIPHHLIDHVQTDEEYSAGRFAREARAVLARMRSRGVMPVLVGGTGLYLEALLKGLFLNPGRSPRLRARLQGIVEKQGSLHLWRILARLDSRAAKTIHQNDTHKLVRAIEVCLLGKRPMTDQWRDSRDGLAGYRFLILGLNPIRESLYARIDARAAQMFEQGLVDEVRGLLAAGIPRTARPFGSLGYAQCLQYVDGNCTLNEAVDSTAQQTRRYAKRQLTWFRRRTPEARWFDAFGNSDQAGPWAEGEVQRWERRYGGAGAEST